MGFRLLTEASWDTLLHLAIAVFGQTLQICPDNQQKEVSHR